MSHPYANRLGRRYEHDERDHDLAAFIRRGPVVKDESPAESAVLDWLIGLAYRFLTWIGYFRPDPQPTPSPADVEWQDNEPVLDQGDYGTCVGNGWAQWGNTLPVDDHYVEKDARAIYYESTVIDGHPDDPDAPGGGQDGSTVRAGAKAMQNRERLSAYAFTQDVDVAIAYLQDHGPVVFGTNWYDSMFSPDGSGVVEPTGQVAGGHCYTGLGYDEDTDQIECINSWGSGWGEDGRFFIAAADMQRLLNEDGEACGAVELP